MEKVVEEGVRGKMWRVVKGMYHIVESAVLVGEESTGLNYRREFDRGVSCLLSCFLCSLTV